MPRILPLLWVLILSACAGPPTIYLALAPMPPSTIQAAAGLPLLAVSSVDIPPDIDRLHLTTGTPPGTLHVAGHSEWAGPIGPMARIVLAQDLAARLPGTDVLMPGDALPPGGAATLHVTIQTFMPDALGRVALQADWTVNAARGQNPLASGRFAQTVGGGTKPAAEAQSMSTAMAALADAIAKGLARQV